MSFKTRVVIHAILFTIFFTAFCTSIGVSLTYIEHEDYHQATKSIIVLILASCLKIKEAFALFDLKDEYDAENYSKKSKSSFDFLDYRG